MSRLLAVAAGATSGAIWNQIWNHIGQKSEIGHSGDSEVPVVIGGPWRTRTSDPLIKSCPEPRTQDTQDDPRLTNQSDPD
jgi:hypothetical protein